MPARHLVVLILLGAFPVFSPDATATTRFLTAAQTDTSKDIRAVRAVSPDGRWIVFEANYDSSPGLFDLYSIQAVGNDPTLHRLSTASLALTKDHRFVGERVLWIQTDGGSGKSELWSAPIDGSAPGVRLDLPGNDRTVTKTWVHVPTGRVVIRAVEPGSSTSDDSLWSAPVDGSTPAVRLHQHTVEDTQILGTTVFQGRVLYIQAENGVGIYELWSAPVDGTTPPVRLHAPLLGNQDVSAFTTTTYFTAPGGAQHRVLFVADLGADDVRQLYRVPLGGATPVPLTSFGGEADVAPEPLLAIGDRVAFVADGASDEAFDLYLSPVSSAAPQRLTSLASGRGVVDPVLLSLDGARLVYRADASTDEKLELYAVGTDGTAAPMRLGPPLTTGGAVTHFELAPGGSRVVFRADRFTDDVFGLFSARLLDGAYDTLSPGVPAIDACPGVCTGWVLTEDDRVLFRAASTTDPETKLYTNHVQGGEIVALSASDPLAWDATLDGSVAFLDDLDVEGAFDLYRARGDGSLPPARISELYASAALDVTSLRLFADGSRVAYVSDEHLDELFGLWIGDDGRHTVELTVSSASADEAEGVIEIPLTLSQASIARVAVQAEVTGAGTAAPNVDFRFPDGAEVAFIFGEQETSLRIEILDDSSDEPNETAVLELSAAVAVEPDTFTLGIIDDDEPTPAEPIFIDGFESGDTSAWAP